MDLCYGSSDSRLFWFSSNTVFKYCNWFSLLKVPLTPTLGVCVFPYRLVFGNFTWLIIKNQLQVFRKYILLCIYTPVLKPYAVWLLLTGSVISALCDITNARLPKQCLFISDKNSSCICCTTKNSWPPMWLKFTFCTGRLFRHVFSSE